MRDVDVAVIIPAWNAEATLARAVESVLGEGVRELVIVDDGSTDRTNAIAKSFEPEVRTLSGTNAGVSHARNRGIAETQSEWLLFLDADDELVPGTIRARLAAPGAGEALVIISDWQNVLDKEDPQKARCRRTIDWAAIAEDAEVATASHVWASTAAILYRRDIVDRIGGFRSDLPVIQDARFLFDAVRLSGRPIHAPHVGARYHVSPGSLSRRDRGRFAEDILRNGRQIEVLWRARGSLTQEQVRALARIYNEAARGLFSAENPLYFDAVAAQRALDIPLPIHTRLAAPVGQMLGQSRARRLLALIGRG